MTENPECITLVLLYLHSDWFEFAQVGDKESGMFCP